MPARESYTPDDVEACRDTADALLAAWQADEVEDSTLENLVFGQAVIALDAWFVHRDRGMEAGEVNPMLEVRVLADSLISHGGVLHVDDSVRWVPQHTVLHLDVGDEVLVTADGYERLAAAYLAAVEAAYPG